jgi:hypothetical protein
MVELALLPLLVLFAYARGAVLMVPIWIDDRDVIQMTGISLMFLSLFMGYGAGVVVKMIFNNKDQTALNVKHVNDPQPGDFWHEMYAPIIRVLGRTADGSVIVQKVHGLQGTDVRDDDPAPIVMTLTEFKRWVSYQTMPDKTYCDVMPNKLPPQRHW